MTCNGLGAGRAESREGEELGRRVHDVIPVVCPPLAVITWPCTKFDQGEQRKKIGPAASSAVAGLPSGMIVAARSRIRSGMPSGISTSP